MGDEADALYDMGCEFEAEEHLRVFSNDITLGIDTTWDIPLMRQRYITAKTAKVHQDVICPFCGKPFKKKSYQQAFCSRKKNRSGASKCKDRYWNTVDDGRRSRMSDIRQFGY